MQNGGTEGAPWGDGPSLKRGSVQPLVTDVQWSAVPEYLPPYDFLNLHGIFKSTFYITISFP